MSSILDEEEGTPLLPLTTGRGQPRDGVRRSRSTRTDEPKPGHARGKRPCHRRVASNREPRLNINPVLAPPHRCRRPDTRAGFMERRDGRRYEAARGKCVTRGRL